HDQPLVSNLGSGPTYTRSYVCGDTTQFWINHFDAQSRMTNIFIQLPSYLPYPRQSYELLVTQKGLEQDSSTYLLLKFVATHPQTGMKDTVVCYGYTNRNLGQTYRIPEAYLTRHQGDEVYDATFENCETRRLSELYPRARILYDHYRDSVREVLVSAFGQH